MGIGFLDRNSPSKTWLMNYTCCTRKCQACYRSINSSVSSRLDSCITRIVPYFMVESIKLTQSMKILEKIPNFPEKGGSRSSCRDTEISFRYQIRKLFRSDYQIHYFNL